MTPLVNIERRAHYDRVRALTVQTHEMLTNSDCETVEYPPRCSNLSQPLSFPSTPSPRKKKKYPTPALNSSTQTPRRCLGRARVKDSGGILDDRGLDLSVVHLFPFPPSFSLYLSPRKRRNTPPHPQPTVVLESLINVEAELWVKTEEILDDRGLDLDVVHPFSPSLVFPSSTSPQSK